MRWEDKSHFVGLLMCTPGTQLSICRISFSKHFVQTFSLFFIFSRGPFLRSSHSETPSDYIHPRGGGGGDSHMEGAGMLVVSLRGVNFRFWSRLGCSGQNVIIFSRKGLFKGCTRRNIIKLSFHLLDSCNQSLKWSLLGVKKRLGHAQFGLLKGFNSKFPTSILPFHVGVPHPGIHQPLN